MPYCLAIDSGGSKTDIICFDKHGFSETVSIKGLGISFESDEDLPELREAVSALAAKYDIRSAVVNLGGKNKRQFYNCIKSCLGDAPVSVYRESEGEAALAFGEESGASIVLMAGTGTITAGQAPDGRRIIGGGWGMNIGDGGSGYDIGLNAVRAALIALDRNEPLTPLQKEITGLNAPICADGDVTAICKTRDDVRSRLFPIERKKIAAISKSVARHCESGEEDALRIMAEAGEKMAELVADGLKKLPGAKPVVGVVGGLVGCAEYWKSAFEKKIKASFSDAETVYMRDGLIRGVKLLAEKQIGE